MSNLFSYFKNETVWWTVGTSTPFHCSFNSKTSVCGMGWLIAICVILHDCYFFSTYSVRSIRMRSVHCFMLAKLNINVLFVLCMKIRKKVFYKKILKLVFSTMFP